MNYNFFTYILTNKNKTVLYTGVTNNLANRLKQHLLDAQSERKTFTGKYNCYYLVWFERFQYIQHAIAREKEIKGWSRKKKVDLIDSFNPDWRFMNDTI